MSDVTTAARTLLRRWLGRQVDGAAMRWLDDICARIAGGAPERLFFPSFSGALRRTGKADLELSADDLAEAIAARMGWDPRGWTCDQAARTCVLLSLPSDDPAVLVATLDKVFESADLGEARALYQALPLLPHPDAHATRAAEGVRTNIRAVFEAVAHRNPYPEEHLGEGAWNQMVLKALFVGSRLDPIVGLDRRANAALTAMLVDFAHERWAAGRPVPPTLWRCVAPFAQARHLDDLARVLSSDDALERQAGALALSAAAARLPEAATRLAHQPELAAAVEQGTLTWKDL